MSTDLRLQALRGDPAACLVCADHEEERGHPAVAAWLRARAAGERPSTLDLDAEQIAPYDPADRYTMLWSLEMATALLMFGGRPLPGVWGGHNRDTDMQRMGFGPGDWMYVLTLRKGVLRVPARLRLRRWGARDELPGLPLHGCGSQFGLGDGAIVDFDRTLPGEALARLTFRSKKAERPLAGVEDGRLTRPVGVQGVFRLTDRSALDLEALFTG